MTRYTAEHWVFAVKNDHRNGCFVIIAQRILRRKYSMMNRESVPNETRLPSQLQSFEIFGKKKNTNRHFVYETLQINPNFVRHWFRIINRNRNFRRPLGCTSKRSFSKFFLRCTKYDCHVYTITKNIIFSRSLLPPFLDNNRACTRVKFSKDREREKMIRRIVN